VRTAKDGTDPPPHRSRLKHGPCEQSIQGVLRRHLCGSFSGALALSCNSLRISTRATTSRTSPARCYHSPESKTWTLSGWRKGSKSTNSGKNTATRKGIFFKGSAGALTKLAPGEKTMAQILEIEPMTNVATLGQEYLRCGRWQPLVFGSEVEDARWRKSLQTSVTGRAVFAHCAAVRHAMRASRCIVCCPAGDQFAG
jgi:hypothetical protein